MVSRQRRETNHQHKKTIKKEPESDGLLNEGKEERLALLKATRKQHGRNQRGREPYKLQKTQWIFGAQEGPTALSFEMSSDGACSEIYNGEIVFLPSLLFFKSALDIQNTKLFSRVFLSIVALLFLIYYLFFIFLILLIFI
jgi:hypothetical protein